MLLFVWTFVVMKPEYHEEFILDYMYFARVFHIISQYNFLYDLTWDHNVCLQYVLQYTWSDDDLINELNHSIFWYN